MPSLPIQDTVSHDTIPNTLPHSNISPSTIRDRTRYEMLEHTNTQFLEIHTIDIIVYKFKRRLWRLLVLSMLIMEASKKIIHLDRLLYFCWLNLMVSLSVETLCSEFSCSFIKTPWDVFFLSAALVRAVPRVVWNWILRLNGIAPSDLVRVPKKVFPKSVALILFLNTNLIPPPTDLPESYLDADRVLHVPTQQEMEFAITARNEYVIHQSTHIAAEKARLLSEVGKIVAWSAIVEDFDFINLYEQYGVLWRDGDGISVDAKLCVIAGAVAMELASIGLREEDTFRIPRVTIRDTFSGSLFRLHGNPINPVFDREFIVNLSDIRVEGLSNGDGAGYPPHADLIIIPGYAGLSNKLYGYRCNETNSSRESVINFSELNFGFRLFLRSLHFFAVNQPLDEKV